MDEVGIEPTSSIGDALAMRPLRKIPAGILLPLAELVLGIKRFRSIAMERPQFPMGTGQFPQETVWFAKQTVLCPLDPAIF